MSDKPSAPTPPQSTEKPKSPTPNTTDGDNDRSNILRILNMSGGNSMLGLIAALSAASGSASNSEGKNATKETCTVCTTLDPLGTPLEHDLSGILATLRDLNTRVLQAAIDLKRIKKADHTLAPGCCQSGTRMKMDQVKAMGNQIEIILAAWHTAL